MVQKIVIQQQSYFNELSDKAITWLKNKYPNEDNYLDNRDSEALIHCITELGGDKAGRRSAKFKIIEIPDDVEWEIRSSSGGEYIVEKHRTWR